MLKNNSLLGLNSSPRVMMYLDNQPILTASMFSHSGLDVPLLIEQNGNHWRKIMSIYAKLMYQHGSWQAYRDTELLTDKESLSFESHLNSKAIVHLVCGKAAQARLGLDLSAFDMLLGSDRLFAKGNILCTPYPDYRQFPNREIEIARVWLRDNFESLFR